MKWFREPCLVCEREFEHAGDCMYAPRAEPAHFTVTETFYPLAQPFTVEWVPPATPAQRGFFASALVAVLAFFGGEDKPAVPSLSRRGFLKGVAVTAVAAVLMTRKAPEAKTLPTPMPLGPDPIMFLNQMDGVKLIQLHLDGLITRDVA